MFEFKIHTRVCKLSSGQAGAVKQKNEGRWEHYFKDADHCITLDLCLGKGVPTDEIRVEIHDYLVRLLIKVSPTLDWSTLVL